MDEHECRTMERACVVRDDGMNADSQGAKVVVNPGAGKRFGLRIQSGDGSTHLPPLVDQNMWRIPTFAPTVVPVTA
ncbi:hypothetical protein BX604_4588 [Burkholderia sp. JKS000303]|nr:hypothetical protein BX604_4588 [Burkholderia sp. JKS000303]